MNDEIEDNTDEIENVKAERSTMYYLGVMGGGLLLLGGLAFGGLKLYKNFNSSERDSMPMLIAEKTNNDVEPASYVEELSKEIPAPKNLKIPTSAIEEHKNIQQISQKKNVGIVENIPTPTYINSQKKQPISEEKKREQIALKSFEELQTAISNKQVLLVDNKIKFENKYYGVNEEIGSFVIKKIYNNKRVKFYNKDEKYARRFSL